MLEIEIVAKYAGRLVLVKDHSTYGSSFISVGFILSRRLDLGNGLQNDFKMYIVGERITEIKPNACQLLLPYIKDSQPGY